MTLKSRSFCLHLTFHHTHGFLCVRWTLYQHCTRLALLDFSPAQTLSSHDIMPRSTRWGPALCTRSRAGQPRTGGKFLGKAPSAVVVSQQGQIKLTTFL